MIALLALLVATDVELGAPSACLRMAELEAALTGTAALEIAERVSVHVVDVAGDDAGGVRYDVVIDIALVGVEPLRRALRIRAVECRDLPDLVALLVREQRMTPPPKRAAVVLPAPEPRRVARVDRREPEFRPCGPAGCNDALLGGTVGAYAMLTPLNDAFGSLGVRAAGEVTLVASEERELSAGVAFLSGAAGGALLLEGTAGWRRVRSTIPITLRVGLGAGVGSVGYRYGASLPMLVPSVGARARFGWLILDVGAFVAVTPRSFPAPAVSLGVGLQP